MTSNLMEADNGPPITVLSARATVTGACVNQSDRSRLMISEQSMRSYLIIIALGTTIAACGSPAVTAQPISDPMVFGDAPIEHLQPQAQQQVTPSSAASSAAQQSEQQKISTFDAE